MGKDEVVLDIAKEDSVEVTWPGLPAGTGKLVLGEAPLGGPRPSGNVTNPFKVNLTVWALAWRTRQPTDCCGNQLPSVSWKANRRIVYSGARVERNSTTPSLKSNGITKNVCPWEDLMVPSSVSKRMGHHTVASRGSKTPNL